MADADILIVGGGAAGAAAASTLRAEGFDGSVVLVGREPDPPYERPPASKSYLQGRSSKEDAYLHPASFWDEHGIDLRTRTSVMKLDPGERVATLSTKEEVSFGKALLATGANVRRLRVDGATLDGIHYLRALANADAIRRDTESADRVVLIGGSYIACEVAASLTTLGKSCTIVAMEDEPLSTGFGTAAGRFFRGVLEAHGVTLATGETLTRFEGPDEGRVERVVCESGREIDCDLVVMGTGAVPDVMLARSAGLEFGDSGGVRCDATLRSSAEHVWAAGDMCEYESQVHGRRLRVEHFEVATAEGAHAARAMLGSSDPYVEVPYFWSDLADWTSLEYVGPATAWDREVVRGSMDDGRFTIFYLDGGRVAGALTVGRSSDLDLARRLMTSGQDVGERADALADPDGEL
ncbi:MAG: 3-phenylpropionate/trans-cinnamate dioxygenase ferredoxin reductase component [Solirubrobacteraceae bacterium]|nr:3-phenylpropionate/trans-cinnamate dioxygenase ferredoxin reductase component [Solirubrobacteraceae bacterium]